MKRKLGVFLVAFLLTVCIAAGDKAVHVKAAGDYTNPELTLTQVEDISVYNDYTVNKISIDNSLYYPDTKDGYQIYKFTLNEDGYISFLLSGSKVFKITETIGAKYSYNVSDASVAATVYRDAALLYPVTPSITAVTGKNEGRAELPQKISLDKGTYYMAVKTDRYSSSTNSGNVTTVKVSGTASLIVYYQPIIDYEVYRPSMIGKENQLDMETTFKGLLTVTNPKDYYRFELTDKAMVKINFMYSSLNPAKFTLYSTEREELLSKTFNGSSVWYNVEKYLEPGTYYCSLETTKQYDGGITNILINPTVYPLTLEQVNQTTNSYVTVSTIDDPKEIRFVLGKLTNSELTSAKWNSGKVITDTLLFGVNKTGYYTVRVTDQYGNMFMQSIKINSCDKKAPDIPAIKAYAVSTFVISGTAEKNSLVTVYVNGKAYTCTATSKGTFKCTLPSALLKGSLIEATAMDISGNVSEKAEVMIE